MNNNSLIRRLIRPFERSLTVQILVAFAVVVLVGVGGVALLANDRTTAAFEHYLRGNGPDVGAQLANVAGQLYQHQGSWDGVGRVFSSIPGPPDQRVVIVDPSGQVVVDTSESHVTMASSLTNGRPIKVNGSVVGTLFQVSPEGTQLPPIGRPESGLSPSDRTFLAQVNQSIFLAAIAAIVAALVLAMLLARQIIRPLRQLTRGAQRIARGHLDERIAHAGHDEVAELADAFNLMAESLQRTETARRQLVADIAHELRTPLMVVNATVEAMQDGVLAPDKANLGTIREEITSLARLVSDLRDLSLGDVGQFPMEHEPVDVAGVLESVVAAFGTAAAGRDVHLVAEVPPDLAWVSGDENRLRQCLRNLVDNALRHTSQGGQVTVRGRSENDVTIVEVADTGEGIKPEHVSRVFERFFRADESRNRRSGGSGLGLAIVQQIVRAHGGEITVASDGLGKGATFTVTLPALASETGETVAPVKGLAHSTTR